MEISGYICRDFPNMGIFDVWGFQIWGLLNCSEVLVDPWLNGTERNEGTMPLKGKDESGDSFDSGSQLGKVKRVETNPSHSVCNCWLDD